MAIYREHVLPRLVDRMCGVSAIDDWRAIAARGLEGRVVEIGFGSGLNVKHYPSGVEIVFAVEPSMLAWHMASDRVAASMIAIEQIGLEGEKIPLDDGSCDAALCTFTLCTVSDPMRVMAEIRRVLRPGGQFHFLEHGLSPDAGIAAWQRRLEPIQMRIAGGCHLTRDTPTIVTSAGFDLERVEAHYARAPKPWSWFSAGVGVNGG